MTTKHALKYNGAPHAADGSLINEDSSITKGTGRAKCACDALSPELPTGTARRDWFKGHKANPESWTLESQTITWSEAEPVQDEIPLDPEPAPEPVAEAPVEPEVPEVVEPEFSTVLPFTKAAPASFWRYLGRDAVRRLADGGALGTEVSVATNASNHTILITGPTEGQVDIARARIEQYWDEALESVKEWKTTDPTFLARPREGLEGRKAAFELTGEYYLSLVDKYILELV